MPVPATMADPKDALSPGRAITAAFSVALAGLAAGHAAELYSMHTFVALGFSASAAAAVGGSWKRARDLAAGYAWSLAGLKDDPPGDGTGMEHWWRGHLRWSQRAAAVWLVVVPLVVVSLSWASTAKVIADEILDRTSRRPPLLG